MTRSIPELIAEARSVSTGHKVYQIRETRKLLAGLADRLEAASSVYDKQTEAFATLSTDYEKTRSERDEARDMLHHRERQICNTIMGMIDEPEAHDQLEGLTGFTFHPANLEWMWRILHETEQGNDDDIPDLPPVDEQELWRRVWALAKKFCFHVAQENAQGLAAQRDEAWRALEEIARFTNVMHTWERKPETKLSEVATWITQSIQSEIRRKDEAVAEAKKQTELAEQLRMVLMGAARQHGASEITKSYLRRELRASHDLPDEEWSAYRMRVQRDEARKKLHAANAAIIQQLRVCAEIAALQYAMTIVYFPNHLYSEDPKVREKAAFVWASDQITIRFISVTLMLHADRLEKHGVVE